ncbi:hypothetical protein ACLOJK_022701 [Asimina triloba]
MGLLGLSAVRCRRDLPILAIELPLSCQIWLDSRLGRKKPIMVASWLARSVAVDAARRDLGLSAIRMGDAIDCCLIC